MSDEYAKLKQLWYKKLKAAGFKDIEHPERDMLLQWESMYFQSRHTPQLFENAQSYFYMATHFLNNVRAFRATLDGRIRKEIWLLHTEGCPLRSIAAIIQRRFDVVLIKDRYNKDNIASIIKQLQNQMYAALGRERNEEERSDN